MKSTWKKVLATACTAAMLMTMPGFSVLADAMQEEEYIVTDAEIPEESESFADATDEDVAHSVDEIIEEDTVIQETAEEIAGEDEIQVGDGVMATFDVETLTVELYSDGGTLWTDWIDKVWIGRWNIDTIRVASGTVYLPADSNHVFDGLVNLVELDLSGFDTSNVTDMSYMFNDCSNLTNLDLSSFDTSNVRDMISMFSGCSNLTSLDLSSFDTLKVTDMSFMFNDCSNLTNLDLSSFDTSNVTDMSYMFNDCSNLTGLDLSSFNTSKVNLMSYMFSGCSSLTNLDLSGFDTSNLWDYYDIFDKCKSLLCLQTPQKNSLEIRLPIAMYDESGALYITLPVLSKSIVLTGAGNGEMPVGENVTAIFDEETGTVEFYSNGGELWEDWLDFVGFDKKSLRSIKVASGTVYLPNESSYIFSECYLEDLDLTIFDTSNVTDVRGMFYGCSNLTNLDLSSFDTSNVTYMSYMFDGCSNLTNLDLSSFDTSNVWDMSHMFDGCSNLTGLDLGGFDTSNVWNMSHMFDGCSNLTNLDLRGFDTSNVSEYYDIFDKCKSLLCLQTPQKNSLEIRLPVAMYDESGALYKMLPVLSKSIVLTGAENGEMPVGENVTAIFDEETGTVELYSNGGELWEDWLDFISFDKSSLRSIKVASGTVYLPKDSSYIFSAYYLEDLDLTGFDTSNVTDMSYMFAECWNLTNLDLSSFDTSNVERYESVFSNCWDLTCLQTPRKNSLSIYLPVVMCDESGVIYNMLPVISKSITLTKKETDEIIVGENVTATYDEETGAVLLYSDSGELWDNWLDLSNIYIDSIQSIKVASGTIYLPKDSSGIFADVDYLEELDLSGFNSTNVTNMNSMFEGCYSLTNLDLSGFDTSGVTNMANMFMGCYSLTNLDLSRFDTSDVTNMANMFMGCESLRSLDLSRFDTSNVTDMSYMFKACKSLTSLDLSSLDTSSVTNMANMFMECESLRSLNLSSFDTSNVTIMNEATTDWFNPRGMFYGCKSLTSLDLSSFDTSQVTDMGEMFRYCSSLTSLNLTSFDTSQVTTMSCMFYLCSSLENLDVSNFNTSNVRYMSGMFLGCRGLTSLNLSGFDTSNVITMGGGPNDDGTFGMFEGCSSLTNLDLSNFDTSEVRDMNFMFEDCSSLTNLDLSNFDTSKVIDMRFMFEGCSSLTSLNLSNFDTSKVTCMARMFTDCSSLTSLDLSSFDMSNIENYSGSYYSDQEEMLKGCSALLLLETPKKNEQSVDLPYNMYDKSGIEYEKLPNLSESITLTKEKPDIKTDLNDCEITLSATIYTYDGTAKKPTITAKNGSTILTVGTDYTVSYVDNTDAGTATAKVTGTGDYKGEKDITFTINKADTKLTFAESEVTKKTTDSAFTNTLTKTTDGTVTFESSNTSVATVNSTSGLVTIKGSGAATITATAAEGKNYKKGSTAFTLTVKAPAPTPTPKPTSTPVPKPTTEGFSDVQDPNHAYYKAIYWAADAGITKGYSDGTFGINRNCTRGEMMMFLWRYAGKPAPKNVSKSPFKDVPKTHTFYTAILWGSQKGITKGYSDGTFGINRNVSRGECMMFLWRLKGKPTPKAVDKAPFSDVPKSHVFYNAVLWGYQKKITTGFTSGKLKGKFGVNENCSRGQIVTFLYRAK